MRSISSTAGAIAVLLASTSGVLANDLNWSGFNAGIHAGYAWGKGVVEGTAPTQKPSGAIVGIGAGLDHQFDNGVVLGVLADLTVGSVSSLVEDGSPYLIQTSKLESMGTLRGRIGFAHGQFLPYVTGGLAWAKINGGIACIPGAPSGSLCHGLPLGLEEEDTITKAGWALGVGTEYAISSNWSAKVEYLYTDLGTASFDLGLFGEGRSKITASTLKLGASYRF